MADKRQGTGSKKIEIKKTEYDELIDSFIQSIFANYWECFFMEVNEFRNLHPDANVAVVAFSPHGKPYGIGSPSVVDYFLLDQQNGGDGSCPWWEMSLEGMELNLLKEYQDSLLKLKKNVCIRLQDLKTRRLALREFF